MTVMYVIYVLCIYVCLDCISVYQEMWPIRTNVRTNTEFCCVSPSILADRPHFLLVSSNPAQKGKMFLLKYLCYKTGSC